MGKWHWVPAKWRECVRFKVALRTSTAVTELLDSQVATAKSNPPEQVPTMLLFQAPLPSSEFQGLNRREAENYETNPEARKKACASLSSHGNS